MTITTTTLARAAGLSAVVGGLLFVAVQINHPPVNLALVTTTEWKARQSMKVALAALSLAGITGMYLRQVKWTGVLGLIGYLVFAVNYLIMLSNEVIGLFVLPTLASSAPGYVSDVLAAATGGTVTGELGLYGSLNTVAGFAYMGGGLIFGIALFRAAILARWAAAALALGTIASIAIPFLPQVNQRLFAIPTGIALAGLGYSLWREQRTTTARAPRGPVSPVSPQLDPAGAK
jgi:hypothetical protein